MKKNLSFAYIQHHGLPSVRAHSVCISKTAESASRIFTKTYLIVPNLNNVPEERILKYYNLQNSSLKIVQLKTVDLRRYSLIPKFISQKFWFLISAWIFSFNAYLYLIKHRIQVVQTGDRELPLLIKVFNKNKVNPFLIYDVHYDFSQNRYDGPMENLVLNRFNLLVVNCQFLNRKFLQCGLSEDKIIVLPNGYDPEDYGKITKSAARVKFKLPLNRFIVGFIGRFEVYGLEKGITELIDAALILKQKSVPITVVAIGGPELLVNKYKKYARSKSLNKDEVVIRDYIFPSEVGNVISAFDVCSLLYPPVSYYIEKMSPMKAIEYQAADKTIIATNIPAIKDMLGESACYPINFTAKDIADKLYEIYTQKLYLKKHQYRPLSWQDRMEVIAEKIED